MKLVQTSLFTSLLIFSTSVTAFDMPWDNNDRRDRWRGHHGGDNRWDSGFDAFDDAWGDMFGDMFGDFDFEITVRANAEGWGRGRGRGEGRGRGRGYGRGDNYWRGNHRGRYYGGNVYGRPYSPYGYQGLRPGPRPGYFGPAPVARSRYTPPVAPPPPQRKIDDKESANQWKMDREKINKTHSE